MSRDKSGFLPDLLKAWLFRGATDESTITERVEWNLTTKVLIPALQAAVMVLGILCFFVGGWVILGVYTPAQKAGEAWAWLALAFGTAFLVPATLLCGHLARALRDQYWNVGRLERAIIPHISALFREDEAEPEHPPRMIPGQRHGLRFATSRAKEPTGIHPEDQRMIDFITQAARIGLARRHWLGNKLNGERVTRDTFDAIMADLQRWGFVDPGGNGVAAQWKTEPGEALEILEQEAQNVRGGKADEL